MNPYRPLPVINSYPATNCSYCKWDNSHLFGDDPWDCCGIRVGNWLGFGIDYPEPTREEQASGRCPQFTQTWWHRLLLLLRVRSVEYRVDVAPVESACAICGALSDQNCDAGLHS